MDVMIAEISLTPVKKPLKMPFKTSLQTVEEREAIIVKITDASGLEGFGECLAFSTPWYTEETLASCQFVMEQVLTPLLEGRTLGGPEEVQEIFIRVKGNRMAKAAIEMAVWDLFAKKQGLPLWKMMGGEERTIPAGVVVAADEDQIRHQVEAAAAKGYRRAKIKINPFTDAELMETIISQYPELLFFADANGAFTEATFERLLNFDRAGFALIEQPFGEQQWHLHARAKKEMKTPICLDESIGSFEDVERMIAEQAGDVIVLKMGRLGGWTETLKIVSLCREHSIGMWVGGMIEFGISKAHNLALGSLLGNTLPGDFSDSQHFWHKDLIEPEICVADGQVELSEEPGIGYCVKLGEGEGI